MKSEWRKAPDFAEVAEALGINTESIMAWSPQSGAVFTPDLSQDDPMIYVALTSRDADGILVAGPWSEWKPLSEFMAEANEKIGKALEEKLGPPGGAA